MGRYKSVLRSAQDAKLYPHHVDVPVPGVGLGKQMDRMSAWLDEAVGSEWKQHGAMKNGVHLARYMFRLQIDASRFEDALNAGVFRELPDRS